MIRAMLAACIAFAPAVAQAEDWYVDQDAACDGEGTLRAPFCRLDDALTSALQPGDTINLMDAAEPYAPPDFSGAADGSESAPIVLQPAPGHAPVLAGDLVIAGRSHWTIRGLFIDVALGDAAAEGVGIYVSAEAGPVSGISIVGNTIVGARKRAIRVGTPLNPAVEVLDARVVGNHVQGAQTVGIEAFTAHDIVIADNIVEGVRCSEGQFIQQEGIGLYSTTVRAEVARNVVRAFVPCPVTARLELNGIRARTDSEGEIHHNLVEVAAVGGARFSGGISVHDGARNFVVHHNVVQNTDGCGLCDGAGFPRRAEDDRILLIDDNVWAHNTVVNTEVAMAVRWTSNARIYGNVLRGRSAGLEVIEAVNNVVTPIVAPGQISDADGNLYFAEDDATRAIVVEGAPTSLSMWNEACDCDSAATDAAPRFDDADGLTPTPDSPQVDGATATAWGEAFHGSAPDRGALESLLVGEATVDAAGVRVQVDVESGVAPPLLGVVGCAGLAVTRDETPLPLSTCEAMHDAGTGVSTIAITLATPLFSGDDAVVVHQGLITDSTAIGAVVGARLPAFSLPLDTSALEPPGSDASSSGGADSDSAADAGATTTGGESGTDGTEGPGAAPTEDGCGCASDRPEGLIWTLLVALALGWRRRGVG